MTKKTRYIPAKNYILAFIMLAAVIFLFVYAFQWRSVKEEEGLLESYLIKTSTLSLEIQTLEELETFLIEQPEEFFIFTGYTNDEEEYELEKDLKPIIDDYNLASMFYYLDVTKLKDDELTSELSSILDTDINYIPSIIYFKDGKVAAVLDKSNNDYLEAMDLENLLKIYEFEKSN